MGKIAEHVAAHIQAQRASIGALEMLAPRLEPIESISAPWSFCAVGGKIIISISAKTFRDAAPILEEIEGLLRIEFDSTHDEPNYNWREFASSDLPGFRVDVSIYPDEDDESCRRVKVGVTEEPVYQFQCE